MRKLMSFILFGAILFLSLSLFACTNNDFNSNSTPDSQSKIDKYLEIPEAKVIPIPLEGDLASKEAEISSLTWYGDSLILLPQYPSRFGDGQLGAIFSLSKSILKDALNSTPVDPLSGKKIPFDSQGVERLIPGFEGYEAISIEDSSFYLTIEARPGLSMKAYLIKGEIKTNPIRFIIDKESLTEIGLPAQRSNSSYEALLIDNQGNLLAFFEINGLALNSKPIIQRYTKHLQPLSPLQSVHLEYRLTDATALDENNHFWVINYFYPGDKDLLPKEDPLKQQFGIGLTHQKSNTVERLVELSLGENRIEFSTNSPIYLELLNETTSRNWEGIVRFDNLGFLIATDRFPETILAFVSHP